MNQQKEPRQYATLMNCDIVGVVQLQGEQVEASPDAAGHCVSGWSWHAAAARLLLAARLDGQVHPLTLSYRGSNLCHTEGQCSDTAQIPKGPGSWNSVAS